MRHRRPKVTWWVGIWSWCRVKIDIAIIILCTHTGQGKGIRDFVLDNLYTSRVDFSMPTWSLLQCSWEPELFPELKVPH